MKSTRLLTGTYSDVLPPHATLTLPCESPSGAYRGPLRRRARGVASALAILMSIGITPIEAYQTKTFDSPKELIKYVANKQLTDKQYHCHNEIIYRESRWNHKAVGNIGGTKQAYGLYQLKIRSMRVAHVEVQFWKYWEYVSYRYGITEYDEPMYCAALHHLVTKGWQ
jgi:hypothetical protein